MTIGTGGPGGAGGGGGAAGVGGAGGGTGCTGTASAGIMAGGGTGGITCWGTIPGGISGMASCLGGAGRARPRMAAGSGLGHWGRAKHPLLHRLATLNKETTVLNHLLC